MAIISSGRRRDRGQKLIGSYPVVYVYRAGNSKRIKTRYDQPSIVVSRIPMRAAARTIRRPHWTITALKSLGLGRTGTMTKSLTAIAA
jgi:hypothetical protein